MVSADKKTLNSVPRGNDVALRSLLGGIVDYAGLFPPTELDMAAAVANYADYASGPDVWMLGAFVVPATRLDEFEAAAKDLLPRSGDAWPLSILVGPDPSKFMDRIDRFAEEHSTAAAGLAQVASLEGRGDDLVMIGASASAVANRYPLFLELPWRDDPAPLIAATRQAGCSAKLRSGGVTPDRIPPVDELTRFLAACARADLSFKVTAGLHHPVRAEHALSYEPGAVVATMHGFLNVFVAAALLRSNVVDEDLARHIVDERDINAFRVNASEIVWRDHTLSATDVAASRNQFAKSFGSCSFDEPRDDLRKAKFL